MKVFIKQYSTSNFSFDVNQCCEVSVISYTAESMWKREYVITTGEYKGYQLKRSEFLTVQEMRKKKLNKI